jgi:hypothetical protein
MQLSLYRLVAIFGHVPFPYLTDYSHLTDFLTL